MDAGSQNSIMRDGTFYFDKHSSYSPGRSV